MTFEEFFKKKKINLPLFNTAEPELFAEFESHYQLMGEKSFDHTKKYWFNLLRRKYHLPDEPKVEKVIIENQIAEQTVTESIIEQPIETPAPKLGFKPKFKMGTTTAVPAENIPAITEGKAKLETTGEAPVSESGFKPKFKMGTTTVTPIGSIPEVTEKKARPETAEETPVPKLGFKPKFKAGITKPVQTKEAEPGALPTAAENLTNEPEIKPAYKPKFKPGMVKPKTNNDE